MNILGIGGSGKNPYEGLLTGGIGTLRNTGQQFRGLASQQGSLYNQYQPQAQQALGDYAGLLRRNATDSDKAGYVNSLTGDVQRNFLAGQAGLAQNLAQRGLSPDSSVNAGAQAILEGQRAAALSQAMNQGSQYFDQRQLANADQLQGLLGGAANQALGLQGQFLSQGLGADEAGLGYANSLYQSEEQRRLNDQNQLLGLIGAGTSAFGPSLGALFSRRGGGGGYSADSLRAAVGGI